MSDFLTGSAIPSARRSAAIEDRATRFIRIGKVSDVLADRCAVRVVFGEFAEAGPSFVLPVLQPFAFGNESYVMPDVGDRVYCVFQPHDPAAGCVVGSFYAGSDEPPISEGPDVVHLKMKDGAAFEYDREKHVLKYTFPDGGSIIYDAGAKAFSVYSPDTILLTSEGKQTAEVGTDHLTDAPNGQIKENAIHVLMVAALVEVIATEFRVTAAACNIQAVTTITGALTVNGPIIQTGGGGINTDGNIDAQNITATGDIDATGTVSAPSVAAGALDVTGLTATGTLTIGGLAVLNISGFWKTG